jgi:hypothetical protein
MPARIKCKKENINEIKDFVMKGLIEIIEDIDAEEEDLSVTEIDDELFFEFPVGEVYGYAGDYVQLIPDIFKKIKKKYPDVEIWGLAYEDETVCAVTFGPLFYCSSTAKSLKVVYDWQQCIVCGEVLEKKAFYNSSQWDSEEGNLNCLCCPTCALEYAMEDSWGEIEPNESLPEEVREDFYNEKWDCDPIKKFLMNKIKENLPKCLKDFQDKKERILKLLDNENLTEEQKDLINEILSKLD